jgi:hypothetical protein
VGVSAVGSGSFGVSGGPSRALREVAVTKGVSEYLDVLKDALADNRPFVPKPFYSFEGDTLFYYAKDVPSFAKRLNPTLTVILSSNDESLVGVKIKGFRRILERMQRVGLDCLVVRGEAVEMKAVLVLATIVPPDNPDLQQYEAELELQFGDVSIDADELLAAR